MQPGNRILITAGPTRQPIDAVRYLSNRSSGRIGIALAEAAAAAGLEVMLLLGPGDLPPPEGIDTGRFETADDLTAMLEEHFPRCDVLVMAAAVSDYQPVQVAPGKMPRGDDRLVRELEPTPDLVAACAARKRPDQRICAFALDSPDRLHERAAEKLRRKNVDAIVANPLDTMSADTITATVLTPDGQAVQPGPLPKPHFAAWLIAWLMRHF